jgi:hypothetical protein
MTKPSNFRLGDILSESNLSRWVGLRSSLLQSESKCYHPVRQRTGWMMKTWLRLTLILAAVGGGSPDALLIL